MAARVGAGVDGHKFGAGAGRPVNDAVKRRLALQKKAARACIDIDYIEQALNIVEPDVFCP